MKEEKLFAALDGIDENYLEEAARFGARKKRSLRPARVLIAAAVVAALTVTAGAVYVITHQNTKALMETGPNRGTLSDSHFPQPLQWLQFL